MSICILDPACHMPGLKKLFPDAEFYSHYPDAFFKFVTTPHLTPDECLRDNGFAYRTDWLSITPDRYSTIFVVAPLYDYYHGFSPELKEYTDRMKERISELLRANSSSKIALFDIYDYDYDPVTINTEWKVDYYFKRNYVKTKTYAPNVFPFPVSMFVKPCVLTMAIDHKFRESYSVNSAFWCGGLYTHIDNANGIVRDRKSMHDAIGDKITTLSYLPYNAYIEEMRKYKLCVDLLGVGNPNKRTIEALSNGILLLSMCGELEWGFLPGDKFHPDTFFSTPEEFNAKLQRFLTDEDHYNHCLNIQNKLVAKYFNIDWLSTYIKKNMSI